MLVSQSAIHIELQAGAGSGWTSEPQDGCVCTPVGQAGLLEVHCVDLSILALVPHQHCPGGEVSMGLVSHSGGPTLVDSIFLGSPPLIQLQALNAADIVYGSPLGLRDQTSEHQFILSCPGAAVGPGAHYAILGT